jgi:hypothetical protein
MPDYTVTFSRFENSVLQNLSATDPRGRSVEQLVRGFTVDAISQQLAARGQQLASDLQSVAAVLDDTQVATIQQIIAAAKAK